MSDMARQSLGDKAGAALKPDSQKTLLEQGKDAVVGKADNAASGAQPTENKSYTQQAGDAIGGSSNNSQGGILDSAKQALGMDNANRS
ncbi:heat shock protein 9/12-domain-containing protein [Filobasidium floriforme]|uniref:heat shock protein 9/12-domain-containing protein n=1 Tax=Filobasidium floriforme TaxID=5210 RepID=UPI001E8D574D|nr:heat shock protein 9/12-domain-containing protein [Filobasidium floriforme]KAH8084075.1 heat shock protein 9/12-domain-containing protein [Filobasidium floriforme]